MSRQQPVAGIVLAAGESTRLGVFKPLLRWPASTSADTLVSFQVAQLLASGVAPVVVVTGAQSSDVAREAEHAGAQAIFNPDFVHGKASSVRTGVQAVPNGRRILVIGVDQPRSSGFMSHLVGMPVPNDAIVVPSFAGRRGHPPIFAASLRTELLAVNEATAGLRAVLRGHDAQIVHVETEDPQALLNINTAEDLLAARSVFASLASPAG